MSLSKKLLLSTIFVLLLVSLGGAGVIYLSWQREVLTSELMEQIGGAHADTFARLHVMGLTIAGLAFGSGVVVFLFMVWNSWLSVVRVAVPLGRFSAMLGNSSGTVAIDNAIEHDAKRRDEIGSIARAILDLCRSRAQLEADEKQRALETEEKEMRHMAMEAIVKNFGLSMNEVVGSLSAAAAELETSAHAMDQTALQTNNLAATLMEESQKVDASMHDVASAEGALSQTIGQIRSKVHTARDITQKAVTEAQDSRKNISQLVDEVNKIGEVLTLISDIAGQTNLLALNATIEAARAGEVGKGFAVVASEVKNLAAETARATEDIAGRIKRIQAATVTSSQTIDAFAETVASIGQISADITQSVDLQGEATDSIARSVNAAAASTETFSTNVSEVTRAAAETGQAVRGVTAASTHVARQSDALHKLADGFMADIKNLE